VWWGGRHVGQAFTTREGRSFREKVVVFKVLTGWKARPSNARALRNLMRGKFKGERKHRRSSSPKKEGEDVGYSKNNFSMNEKKIKTILRNSPMKEGETSEGGGKRVWGGKKKKRQVFQLRGGTKWKDGGRL